MHLKQITINKDNIGGRRRKEEHVKKCNYNHRQFGFQKDLILAIRIQLSGVLTTFKISAKAKVPNLPK